MFYVIMCGGWYDGLGELDEARDLPLPPLREVPWDGAGVDENQPELLESMVGGIINVLGSDDWELIDGFREFLCSIEGGPLDRTREKFATEPLVRLTLALMDGDEASCREWTARALKYLKEDEHACRNHQVFTGWNVPETEPLFPGARLGFFARSPPSNPEDIVLTLLVNRVLMCGDKLAERLARERCDEAGFVAAVDRINAYCCATRTSYSRQAMLGTAERYPQMRRRLFRNEMQSAAFQGDWSTARWFRSRGTSWGSVSLRGLSSRHRVPDQVARDMKESGCKPVAAFDLLHNSHPLTVLRLLECGMVVDDGERDEPLLVDGCPGSEYDLIVARFPRIALLNCCQQWDQSQKATLHAAVARRRAVRGERAGAVFEALQSPSRGESNPQPKPEMTEIQKTIYSVQRALDRMKEDDEDE